MLPIVSPSSRHASWALRDDTARSTAADTAAARAAKSSILTMRLHQRRETVIPSHRMWCNWKVPFSRWIKLSAQGAPGRRKFAHQCVTGIVLGRRGTVLLPINKVCWQCAGYCHCLPLSACNSAPILYKWLRGFRNAFNLNRAATVFAAYMACSTASGSTLQYAPVSVAPLTNCN